MDKSKSQSEERVRDGPGYTLFESAESVPKRKRVVSVEKENNQQWANSMSEDKYMAKHSIILEESVNDSGDSTVVSPAKLNHKTIHDNALQVSADGSSGRRGKIIRLTETYSSS